MKTISNDIKYKTNDDEINAYLARPEDEGKYPGVVMIHAIFGLDKHIRKTAEKLAAQGYVVLAPDLFSSNKLSPVLTKENIGEALKFMMAIPPEKQRDEAYRAAEMEKLKPAQREAVVSVSTVLFANRPVDLFVGYMSSGIDYLNSLSNVNGKIGSVGFCFGGNMSINLGCTGRVDATVIFYGENPSPIEKIQNVKGAVMGLYGGEDTRINSKIDELVKALVTYKKPFTVKVFPGAYHAFFDNSHKKMYNKAAAKESWKMLLRFYENNLALKE
jgi:carboxymethylenebutenolidase